MAKGWLRHHRLARLHCTRGQSWIRKWRWSRCSSAGRQSMRLISLRLDTEYSVPCQRARAQLPESLQALQPLPRDHPWQKPRPAHRDATPSLPQNLQWWKRQWRTWVECKSPTTKQNLEYRITFQRLSRSAISTLGAATSSSRHRSAPTSNCTSVRSTTVFMVVRWRSSLLVPPTERIIAHSEHPQAYGSTTKHRVKFIESYLLRSQKISPERHPSDASTVLSPSLTPVSSAASISGSSLGSPVFTTNNSVLKEESRCQEYDFERIKDYERFQELLMGPDVKLQLQVPVQSITAKKYEESKPTKESQLQYLRLWESDGRQTMMFFANLSSTKHKYREYMMENLRPVESKSKITIRLEVHLPGMVRRRSSSKSPLIIAKPSALERARLGGDTDENDMANLDYLSIEFSSAEDRTAFLREARFHGSPEDLIASPFVFHSRSPTWTLNPDPGSPRPFQCVSRYLGGASYPLSRHHARPEIRVRTSPRTYPGAACWANDETPEEAPTAATRKARTQLARPRNEKLI